MNDQMFFLVVIGQFPENTSNCGEPDRVLFSSFSYSAVAGRYFKRQSYNALLFKKIPFLVFARLGNLMLTRKNFYDARDNCVNYISPVKTHKLETLHFSNLNLTLALRELLNLT